MGDSIIGLGCSANQGMLEKKVVTECSEMLTREEIDENPTVYIDAGFNGQDRAYLWRKMEAFVNATTGQKSDEDRRN